MSYSAATMAPPMAPAKKPALPNTERVVGLSAVRAVIEQRPKDAISLAHSPDVRKELRDSLQLLAKLRVAYREVPREELDRMADSVHHEGVCLLARAREAVTTQDIVKQLDKNGFWLALDRVDNPHNVGAILRSAAFFGARGLVVASREDKSLTSAMVRIAEGGAERVPVLFTNNLPGVLDACAAQGVAIVGADGGAKLSLGDLAWPDRCVIVLGSERSGMTDAVRKRLSREVRIEGTGHVESLNVSVAAGIFMASRASRRST